MVAENLSQYLTFRVEKEQFALNVAQVREVLEYKDIIKIPGMSTEMKGVINIRGRVVPVVDMRLKFGLEEKEPDNNTSIIVAELSMEDREIVAGLLTDSVNEVIDINPEDIEPPPKIGLKIDSDYLQGMGKYEDEFLIILNIHSLFRNEELTEIMEQVQEE